MINNNKIPVLGFAAYSGTGKTTLLEKLIPELKNRGLKIAVVKHDAHGLTFDHEGKDSWRFSHAGADYSIVNGPDQAAVFMSRSLAPEEAFAFIPDADLILVEGYKQGSFSQIGISRKATGKGFTAPLERFVAVVTDDETVSGIVSVNGTISEAAMLEADSDNASEQNPEQEKIIPAFGFEDIDAIAAFIIEHMGDFTVY